MCGVTTDRFYEFCKMEHSQLAGVNEIESNIVNAEDYAECMELMKRYVVNVMHEYDE